MRRLAWAQLRFRPGRTLALLVGMLLATTAFTVLTAASRTSQLRTVGTVSANFRADYDILVRPHGDRTPIERATGTVQPDFMSGIYGGITMAQDRQIRRIAGVQVAAPVALVGYSLPIADVPVRLPAAALAGSGRELLRVSTTWLSAGGLSQVRQPPSFVYLTPNRLAASHSSAQAMEMLPGGARVPVCAEPRGGGPFSLAQQADNWCWSRTGGPGDDTLDRLSVRHPGFTVGWTFPILIAAVDPAAEARLDGLNHAVTSGRYLAERAGDKPAGGSVTTFPVLAAAAGGVSETAVTRIQRLPQPAGVPSLTSAGMAAAAAEPGQTVTTVRTTAGQAYRQLLAYMSRTKGPRDAIEGYWSAGPVRYQRGAGGALAPVPVRNPAGVWQTPIGGTTPVDETGPQFRRLVSHAPTANAFSGAIPVPQLVGVFNPARVQAGGRLSRVPLGPYAPAAATPASAASRQALGGQDLLPSLNLGGLVSQPVNLITTLTALPALQNLGFFSGSLHQEDPISVIRVKVAGVTGPNAVSRERINEVAQQIAVRTGLTVDIVAGSSPAPTAIDVPAAGPGQPALRLTEGWVKKGVAVAILTAVDKKSVTLFVLILCVCGLFVANAATAAVRSRRRELGVLACLGWTRPRLFAAVIGELAVIGLVAGVGGGLLSVPLSAALNLHPSAGRAALAIPVAIAVAVLSGAVPAWLAARASPLAAVRPPVLAVRRGRHPAGITGLAVANVARTPGRTLLGATSLAVGVAALTLAAAITLAFRGVVVGSLLGDAVAVQIRGVDYLAITAIVALGVLAVADVLVLNVRERAAELATIRQFGWPESALTRLVVTEGALIGAAGSLAGAAAGLAAAAQFTGQFPGRLIVAAAGAALAGVLVTAVAALPPARALRSLPAARLLSEE
ncbi:MAG TPA: ABC transporter permease [Streptosporangiaceae bacterium]